MSDSEVVDATHFQPYSSFNAALLSGNKDKMDRCLRLMDVKIAQLRADLQVLKAMRATLAETIGEEEKSGGEKKRTKRKEADYDLVDVARNE